MYYWLLSFRNKKKKQLGKETNGFWLALDGVCQLKPDDVTTATLACLRCYVKDIATFTLVD